MTLTPGTRLGPYEVIARLGEGGMGEGYRATDSPFAKGPTIRLLTNWYARQGTR